MMMGDSVIDPNSFKLFFHLFYGWFIKIISLRHCCCFNSFLFVIENFVFYVWKKVIYVKRWCIYGNDVVCWIGLVWVRKNHFSCDCDLSLYSSIFSFLDDINLWVFYFRHNLHNFFLLKPYFSFILLFFFRKSI